MRVVSVNSRRSRSAPPAKDPLRSNPVITTVSAPAPSEASYLPDETVRVSSPSPRVATMATGELDGAAERLRTESLPAPASTWPATRQMTSFPPRARMSTVPLVEMTSSPSVPVTGPPSAVMVAGRPWHVGGAAAADVTWPSAQAKGTTSPARARCTRMSSSWTDVVRRSDARATRSVRDGRACRSEGACLAHR